jgi:hypothetical protein
MTRRGPLFAALTLTMVGCFASAQTSPKPAASESGITAYVEFGGTVNSDAIYEVNSSVGYDFNSHFGLSLRAPIYFVRPASSTGTSSANGLGDPSLGFHLRLPNPTINVATVLTGTAPVGNSKQGLSTGRATFDWTGRIDHSISNLTPFFEAGISNTTPDSRLFVRPYTTLGLNTHFNGGGEYDVWKFISVGASGYDILPIGQQTVFSRVNSGQGNGGQHGPPFLNNQQTTGSSSIAHDDGFSTWIDASPHGTMDIELGFTRSVVYDLNSVSFSIGVNLRQLHRGNQN